MGERDKESLTIREVLKCREHKSNTQDLWIWPAKPGLIEERRENEKKKTEEKEKLSLYASPILE